ncbi:MAG TPA: hypothetical protein VLA85_19570 [Verrucomicrobiae bacterium]|nr:hypothetical protein [Verrucomicrobiae bacterium]
MRPLRLLHLIDEANALGRHQHLLQPQILEQEAVARHDLQRRHPCRIVAAQRCIHGPAGRQPNGMAEIDRGRIELGPARPDQKIEDALIGHGRDHAHPQPERRQLAQSEVIDDGLEADLVAAILAGQHGKIDRVLDHAIGIE